MRSRTLSIALAVLLFSAAYLLNSSMALSNSFPAVPRGLGSYVLLVAATFVIFMEFVGSSTSARAVYLLTTLLLVMWFLNGWHALSISSSFVDGPFSSTLLINSGAYPRDVLAYIIYPWFAFFGFNGTSMLLLHVYLIFIVASLTFFLVPKPSREMGFVLFGMFFSVPHLRGAISTLSEPLFELLFFELLLAVALNFTFVKNRGVAILEVVVFALLTSITALILPVALLIPLAFVLAYPRGYRRNYLYILLTAVLLSVGNHFFGLPIPEWRTAPPAFPLKEYLVQLFLLLYGLGEAYNAGLRKRGGVGQTWFLGWVVLMFGALYAFFELPFLPLALVLSAFALRLVLLPTRTSRPQ